LNTKVGYAMNKDYWSIMLWERLGSKLSF